MLEFVDPDLEWTYLDQAQEVPEPQVCHGRVELEHTLERWAEYGFTAGRTRRRADVRDPRRGDFVSLPARRSRG
jgi:hypothetical protein